MKNQAILRDYQKKLREIDATLSKITHPVLRQSLLELRENVEISIMDLQGQIAIQSRQQLNGGVIL